MRTALTIAGSDSSGGAGIQADIKTMITNGVYAMSAITALTAQNTTGVQAILNVTPEFLGQELDSVFQDIYPGAVKIGMVSDKDLIHVIAEKLENTLTENGHVARGVCVTDEEGHLLKINERTHIEKHDGGTAYTEDDGKTWTMLPEGSTVSMNMWGFSASILKELKDRFPKFLDENLKVNPLKCEYFLPFVVDELLGEKRATVKVLKSMDKWYGVTYKEDKPVVVAAIQNLKDGGLYPQRLWEE